MKPFKSTAHHKIIAQFTVRNSEHITLSTTEVGFVNHTYNGDLFGDLQI